MPRTKLQRPLHLTNPYMKGPDVVAAQRLLEQHGFNPGMIDGQYGPATANAVRAAKFRLGYKTGNVDGAFGPMLYGLLTGSVKPRADMVKRATSRKRVVTKHETVRDKIVTLAEWMIAHEPEIHYRQSRPIDGLSRVKKLPLYTDCSGSITDLYKWAGAPDPNGNRFSGAGYTGTLLAHCRHIDPSQARAADMIVYGPGTGHHVVLILKPGVDPLCFSHGQERGPMEIRHSAEQHYQPRPATFLTCLE